MKPNKQEAPVFTDDPVNKSGLDYRTFVALRTKGHPRLVEQAVRLFSIAGNYGMFWVGLAAAVWIVIVLTGSGSNENIPHGQKVFIVTIMFVYPTLLANFIIKLILGRKRPDSGDPLLKSLVRVPASPSFPSSHAAMSFAAAGAMAYSFPQYWPVFYLVAVLMSLSRVYVGVHYPSDVLAGAGVGLVSSLLWWTVLTGYFLA